MCRRPRNEQLFYFLCMWCHSGNLFFTQPLPAWTRLADVVLWHFCFRVCVGRVGQSWFISVCTHWMRRGDGNQVIFSCWWLYERVLGIELWFEEAVRWSSVVEEVVKVLLCYCWKLLDGFWRFTHRFQSPMLCHHLFETKPFEGMPCFQTHARYIDDLRHGVPTEDQQVLQHANESLIFPIIIKRWQSCYGSDKRAVSQ